MRLLATLKPEKYATHHHSYGVLAEIDCEARRIVRHLKIPAASFDAGNAYMAPLIGGLCRVGDRVVLSAWNFLVEVDYERFEITNVASWPLMADLHGVDSDGSSVWVCSAAIDAVLRLDAETLTYRDRWGPDAPILRDERLAARVESNPLGRVPGLRPLVRAAIARRPNFRFVEREYRGTHKSRSPTHDHHVNDVCFHEGQLYVATRGWNEITDGSRSAVIRVDPGTAEADFFVRPGGFRQMHDCVFVDDRLYVTESGANAVAWREPDGRIVQREVQPAPHFVRGLAWTGRSFWVGFSTLRGTEHPALVVEFDPGFERELGRVDVSGLYPKSVGTAVHGLLRWDA